MYPSDGCAAQPNQMVFSYADAAFTTLTTPPADLFRYPDPTQSTIDGDITRVGNRYHLFYVANDKPGHLRQAISDRIDGGYRLDPTKIDPETVGTERRTSGGGTARAPMW